MPVSIGDVIRIVAEARQAASVIQNVYHCLIQSGVIGDDDTFLNDITGHIENAYGNIDYAVANNVEWGGITAYNLTDDEYIGTQLFTTLGVGGGTTNAMLPPQCAPLVLLRTAAPKRLGKKFLPPITDNVLDDNGTPTAQMVTDMTDYGAAFVGLITGTGGYTLRFGTYDPVTPIFFPFISAEGRDLVATQRRRYTGKGI